MRNTLYSVLLLVFCLHTTVSAQIYDDYLGNGHTIGVKVSSSSDQSPDTSYHTIVGSNITPDLIGAARFLSNATLGASYEDIEEVSQIGINEWIDRQMDLPIASYLDLYKQIHSDILTELNEQSSGVEIDSARRQGYLGFAFYDRLFTESDALRQRTAFALSQIFVITRSLSQINQRGYGLSDYYDVLYQNAFGNFRDLLEQVSLHPIMGVYLSHFKNKKSEPELGNFADENFAREIMQLFTIGLLELNMDGTPRLDAHGNTTPTYDITDVQDLARVFTGLSGGAYAPGSRFFGDPLVFNRGLNQCLRSFMIKALSL